MSHDGPFAGIPERLCVDRFLPEHLHLEAGRLACIERPRDAVLLDPRSLVSERDLRAADDPAATVFQRLGLLRKAKWDVGRTIAIGFHDDAPAGIPSRIMAILEESSRVLNLTWRQVPVSKAEYRVAFGRGNGLWSYIGSQSLLVRDGPTCNLGDINWSDPRDLVRCVRHEVVGHGTGCLHAQSLESYSQIIDLDTEAIIRYYMLSQGWDRATAEAQFRKVASADVEEGLQSRTSIMAYEIQPQFDRRGVGIPFNWDWDETDTAQFRKSYPRIGGTAPEPTTDTAPAPPPTGTTRPLVVGAPPVRASIGARREVDWWDVAIVEPGVHRFRVEPAMVLGLYNADRTGLLSASTYGPTRVRTDVVMDLEPGSYKLGVKHRFARGTGPYVVSLNKIA